MGGDGIRGAHLLAADRGFALGAGLVSRLISPGFGRLLGTIDRALEHGCIEVELPTGTTRVLGGRGTGPAARVHLASWRALVRLATAGSVGWYRAWAEREWSSPDPVALFELFSLNRRSLGGTGRAHGIARAVNHLKHLARANNPEGARRNISFHYDLGNDFYAAWLDRTMTYSSALFAEPVHAAEPLEAAQERKVRVLLDRLHLRPGDRLLEIGCGWGGLAEIAARDYGVHVTGITLSEEQKAYSERRLAAAGLAGRTSIELVDYRAVTGRFDAVASVEMVEAVGREYWGDYMRAIARALKPGGRAAVQLIAMEEGSFAGYAANADFIQTYIFPGGLLICEPEFRARAADAGLAWRDRHGFGLHYAETLKRWRERFNAAEREGRLPQGFDASFGDLWRYYLMYCEGGFRGGLIDVAQVTLVKG